MTLVLVVSVYIGGLGWFPVISLFDWSSVAPGSRFQCQAS